MTVPALIALAGTPAAMGRAHGRACGEAIRRYTAERLALCASPAWTGHPLPHDEILALAQECLAAHRAYAPEIVDELEATADAADLDPAALLITNGFTDFVDLLCCRGGGPAAVRCEDDCTAFIVPDRHSADGHGFLGQTWDMHAGSRPYVTMLRGRPAGRPAFLAFSLAGCVGMIGMNDAGIAIGINNLLGRGRVGVTWPFVVRKALEQRDLASALSCITEAPLAGAHNYLLFDRSGEGINVEAMPGLCRITRSDAAVLVHTNHCLDPDTLAQCRSRPPASQRASEDRLARAAELLAGGPHGADTLTALTRDPTICVRRTAPLEMETCGAVVMQPALGRLWAVRGLPSENPFRMLTL